MGDALAVYKINRMEKKVKTVELKVFEDALKRASKEFNLHGAIPIYKTKHTLAVQYNEDDGRHEVLTNLNIVFVSRLCEKTGLTEEDACFLALAHESGHVELNQKCIDSKEDPSYSISQFKAIGPPLSEIKGETWVAECHKETAIEAYCDAILAEAVLKCFPEKADLIIRAMAEIRKENSLSAHRYGDDYKTSLVFDTILEKAGALRMSAAEAASLAYEDSKKRMGLMENLWLLAKRPVLEDLPFLYEKVKKRIWDRRAKVGPRNPHNFK